MDVSEGPRKLLKKSYEVKCITKIYHNEGILKSQKDSRIGESYVI